MKTTSPATTPRLLLAERITGRPLSTSDLTWIEAQLPAIRNPFAKLLILILLVHIRRNKKEPNICAETTSIRFYKFGQTSQSE
jgi:hypothetical protein